ncbi:MAG: nucleotidyl transferase AbiEii/AbiGii toxin family protein [Actinomycetales bacterium]|nr:nucleotidyl transferase AbiEii/AbiGii toxin family protein [Actinomycetales bacterium]
MSVSMDGSLSAFQREVSAVFFGLPESEGYVLVGGAALLSHGLVDRPTRDLDFFDVRVADARSVERTAQAFERACAGRGWMCRPVRESTTFARYIVSGIDSLEVDIAIDAPLFDSLLRTELGPTPSWLDLAAMKLLAMCSRFEARDYADVFMLHRVVDRTALIVRAADADAGFHEAWLAEALRMMRRIPDDRFPVPADQVPELREFAEQWLAEIESAGH